MSRKITISVDLDDAIASVVNSIECQFASDKAAVTRLNGFGVDLIDGDDRMRILNKTARNILTALLEVEHDDADVETLQVALTTARTIRDAARAECNRLLEENRELRRVAAMSGGLP